MPSLLVVTELKAPPGPDFLVTLCFFLPVQLNLTVVPTLMVLLSGEKKLSPRLIVAAEASVGIASSAAIESSGTIVSLRIYDSSSWSVPGGTRTPGQRFNSPTSAASRGAGP